MTRTEDTGTEDTGTEVADKRLNVEPQDGGATAVIEEIPAESTRAALERLGVHPAGVAIMSPKLRHLAVRLTGLTHPQAVILKQESLATGADTALPARVLSDALGGDALVMGNLSQLRVLCKKLSAQPYGLSELGEEIRDALDGWDRREYIWQHATGSLRISRERPVIMGILNVTPDSFSDGGRYMDPERAVERAREMVDLGADIIDVGGESTRPFSEGVSEREELQRVLPVIRRLEREVDVPISVDTSKPAVARKALEIGASIVNDVTALRGDGAMAQVVAEGEAGVVLMHMLGRPRTMQENPTYRDVVADVLHFLDQRISYAVESGIEPDCTVVDPGIGFGKTVEHNLALLRGVPALRALGRPVLIGTSRKSLFQHLLGLPVEARTLPSVASVLTAWARGAVIFRVHDVKETRQALAVARAVEYGQKEL